MNFNTSSILESPKKLQTLTSKISFPKLNPTSLNLTKINSKIKTLNSITQNTPSIKRKLTSPSHSHFRHTIYSSKSKKIKISYTPKKLYSTQTKTKEFQQIETSIPPDIPIHNISLPTTGSSKSTMTQHPPTLTHQSLNSSHLSTTLHNYYGTYPTSTKLMLHKFGRPSPNHSFTSDVVFDHIFIFIIKSQFISTKDVTPLLRAHPLYQHLYTINTTLQNFDFRPLSKYNTNFQSQTSISSTRTRQFMAAILHYNFHVGSVIRYCGNNYTNEHINVKQLLQKIKNIVPSRILEYVQQRLTIGAPSLIKGHNPRTNFLQYYAYGNHTTITKNPALVAKALIKEDKHNFFLPFPSWMTRFFYHLHLSPEGLVIKPGKSDRLVFDATFKIHPTSLSLNTTWTHVKDEPPIWYGSAFRRHLLRIWNLRISYPLEDILLWDDDVSGAFRLIKYNPEIASAFAAILNKTLCIPVGQNFGGNTSAQNWEGIAMAREYIAEHFSNPTFKNLIHKHKNLLSLIQFSKPPHSKTKFISAKLDTKNKGVFRSDGTPKNTPHNTFVDDNTIADVRGRMPQAMVASAEALFLLLGHPDPTKRRSPLSMEKYYQAKCSFSKKQLGYQINTRRMEVTFPPDKMLKMQNVLHKWHAKRKTYTIRQAAELAGSLEFFASMATWIRFLTYSIKNSILLALRTNTKIISSTKSMEQWLHDSNLSDLNSVTTSRKHFAFSKIMKATWNLKTKFFITTSLRNELHYLHKIFSSKKYKISSPIAHVIPRDPDFIAYGDACLDGAGGFSTSLKFWWFFQWPPIVQKRNIKNFKQTYKSPNGQILSINLFEYVAVIISYAAAILSHRTKRANSTHPFPVIKIYSDNKSAIAWSTKASASSKAGKSMSLLLASLLVNEPMGLWTGYVEGKKKCHCRSNFKNEN